MPLPAHALTSCQQSSHAQLPLPLPLLLPPTAHSALCNLALALALASHKDGFFMGVVAKALVKALDSKAGAGAAQKAGADALTDADISRLLSAYAKLGLFERELFARLAAAVSERVRAPGGAMEPGAAGHVAEALSRWHQAGGGVQLGGDGAGGLPELVALLAQRGVPQLAPGDVGGLKRFLAALRRVGVSRDALLYQELKVASLSWLQPPLLAQAQTQQQEEGQAQQQEGQHA
jgi:hypothetical protein